MKISMAVWFALLIICPAVSWSWTIKIVSAISIDGKKIADKLEYKAEKSAFRNSGRGNYGNVLKALDDYGTEFAIKFAYLPLHDVITFDEKEKAAQSIFHDNEFGGYQHLYKKLAEFDIPREGFPHVVLKGLANIVENGPLTYPVIVMAYYSQDLEEFAGLKQKNAPWQYVTPLQLVNFLLQIVNIIIVLKQCDIIHRDLKPANFMVDNGGKLRLVDFGFANYLNSPLDHRVRRGSITYMTTKELVNLDNFKAPSSKTDFTALVCMMPELVLGYKGFDKEYNAIGADAPKKDKKIYKNLKDFWKLPYVRSRYSEIIEKMFDGNVPEFLPEFRRIVLGMYNDVESPNEDVDYNMYSKQLKEILEKENTRLK